MPFLKVYSNAELKDKNAAQFVGRASELIAAKLGKPIGYVVVSLAQEKTMAFGGSAENKGVLAYMDSIGFNDKEGLIKLLTEFFYERFDKVELYNINIVTTSLPASEVAIDGGFLG